MRIELETSLERWVEAQILDLQQADRIRSFEQAHVPERRARWPVVAALAFGGIMLAAGVLLFVSAHWDELSPTYRMTLLVLMVGGFHAAGAFALERFRALAITLHACGTVSLGAAIALTGQIFNMQEHWPTAVLMWLAGATIGWALLGDWPQFALAAILGPWWLIGEWMEAAHSNDFRIPAAAILLLALCYLSARTGRDDAVRVSLAWLGGLALLPAALIASLSGRDLLWRSKALPDPTIDAIGWAGAILVPLAVAYAFRRHAAWMNAVATVWVIGLIAIASARMETAIYAWCVIGAAGMVAWGIHELRPERINLGMAGFALTIAFFFFSSVMDKLGRSASLMALGTLFVAGGWYWEKLRRRLVARVELGGVR